MSETPEEGLPKSLAFSQNFNQTPAIVEKKPRKVKEDTLAGLFRLAYSERLSLPSDSDPAKQLQKILKEFGIDAEVLEYDWHKNIFTLNIAKQDEERILDICGENPSKLTEETYCHIKMNDLIRWYLWRFPEKSSERNQLEFPKMLDELNIVYTSYHKEMEGEIILKFSATERENFNEIMNYNAQFMALASKERDYILSPEQLELNKVNRFLLHREELRLSESILEKAGLPSLEEMKLISEKYDEVRDKQRTQALQAIENIHENYQHYGFQSATNTAQEKFLNRCEEKLKKFQEMLIKLGAEDEKLAVRDDKLSETEKRANNEKYQKNQVRSMLKNIIKDYQETVWLLKQGKLPKYQHWDSVEFGAREEASRDIGVIEFKVSTKTGSDSLQNGLLLADLDKFQNALKALRVNHELSDKKDVLKVDLSRFRLIMEEIRTRQEKHHATEQNAKHSFFKPEVKQKNGFVSYDTMNSIIGYAFHRIESKEDKDKFSTLSDQEKIEKSFEVLEIKSSKMDKTSEGFSLNGVKESAWEKINKIAARKTLSAESLVEVLNYVEDEKLTNPAYSSTKGTLNKIKIAFDILGIQVSQIEPILNGTKYELFDLKSSDWNALMEKIPALNVTQPKPRV
ncbi:MAG: hypothetical protein QM752_02730 [Gammaproteobacteria bacterium]